MPKGRIIHSRMVIVNKKQLTQGIEPKGRLCVGGHKDPDLGRYEAASPTALVIAHALLLCVATTLGRAISIADVTAAFLQGLALPRAGRLYIRVPSSGCAQEVLDYLKWRLRSENRVDIFEATKSIFGLSESPRLWNLRFREVLGEIGFQESKLIPCLFMKHVGVKLVGLITLCVDDALLAGEPELEADWKILQQKLKFGSWTDLQEGGKFLGRVTRQSADRRLDMNTYCQSLKEIAFDANMADDSPVSRALVGQLGWLAKQGRPDLAFSITYLAELSRCQWKHSSPCQRDGR